MPPRTPKACRVRGCRSTTTDPSGYCESHKSEGWKQYKPGQSRHQRGYGSKWDAMVKNPELTAKKEQESEMSSTGAMLGLDPSSRQRLIGLAGQKKATNPFLKIIES